VRREGPPPGGPPGPAAAVTAPSRRRHRPGCRRDVFVGFPQTWRWRSAPSPPLVTCVPS